VVIGEVWPARQSPQPTGREDHQESSVQRNALGRQETESSEGEIGTVLIPQFLLVLEFSGERRRCGALNVHRVHEAE
jgi:hypothetical protein